MLQSMNYFRLPLCSLYTFDFVVKLIIHNICLNKRNCSGELLFSIKQGNNVLVLRNLSRNMKSTLNMSSFFERTVGNT